jgi:hypothetical protein
VGPRAGLDRCGISYVPYYVGVTFIFTFISQFHTPIRVQLHSITADMRNDADADAVHFKSLNQNVIGGTE